MLNTSTRGVNMEEEDTSQRDLHLANIIGITVHLSVLEFMKASNNHLRGARAILRSRKDPEDKSKSLRSYLAQWEAEQLKVINKLQREVAAMHELQKLAAVDPLTATRH